MMEDYGFSYRHNGTSHITCTHDQWPEYRLTIVCDSTNVRMHKLAAKLCLEVQKREFAEAFKRAENKEEAILAKVPSHLNALFDHETGTLVVTDKQLPQLGITI